MGFQVNRARSVRLAVEAVEELGGEVHYVHEINEFGGYDRRNQSPGPAWLRELIGDEYFVDLAAIEFDSADQIKGADTIADDNLEELCKRLRKLESL